MNTAGVVSAHTSFLYIAAIISLEKLKQSLFKELVFSDWFFYNSRNAMLASRGQLALKEPVEGDQLSL